MGRIKGAMHRKLAKEILIRAIVIFNLVLLHIIEAPDVHVRASVSTRYVNVNIGHDWGNCTNPSAPCQTIQYAINQAFSGDTIKVAAGTYTREAALDICSIYLNYPAVVCIINKDLTLLGGYPSGNWLFSDPVAHPTIIDGQWQHRGVWVQDTVPSDPPAGVTMEGFIVRRGFAQGQPSGSEFQTFAFGGGLLADFSRVTLRNMRFEYNIAAGGGQNNPLGGSAAGAAIAIRKAAGTVLLERIVFFQNWSKAGSGTVRGGYAMGAGLFTLRSKVIASRLELYQNSADAGSTSGSGKDSNGETADAFGAITVMGYADAEFYDIVARHNVVRGGDATTYAGGGFGGAIMSEGFPDIDADGDGQYESVTLKINGCELSDNLSKGADGANGGYGAGGAISTIHSTVFISRCKILRNTAQGGNGSNQQGPAGGGGIHLHNINYGLPTAYVDNSLIAYNVAKAGSGSIVGGGGGGVWLQGITASLVHNTIANNCVGYPLLGSAIAVLSYGVTTGPKPAYIHYNIIAGHTQNCDPLSGALFVHDNNTAFLNRNLFFGNKQNTFILNNGAIYGLSTSVFANPNFIGGSQAEHAFRIAAGSGAIDQAGGSSIQHDIERKLRFNTPDIGAYEYVRSAFLPVVKR